MASGSTGGAEDLVGTRGSLKVALMDKCRSSVIRSVLAGAKARVAKLGGLRSGTALRNAEAHEKAVEDGHSYRMILKDVRSEPPSDQRKAF
jgi:hypothetical protein